MTDHVATCEVCTDETLKNKQTTILFEEVNRAGLTSVLTSRCAGCQQEFRFPTSPKVKGMTGGKQWETNLAAVWGQMATVEGHKPFAEMMAVLGVPTMTKKSFITTEKKIGDWWRDLFAESMITAGKEKREIAITNNSYHQGIPAVTVIVDGGWSKRSHKHSYNAKSGVAIINGKATGKILHMGVRNKFCSICNQHPKTPPSHICFRNWNSSSAAMETDIIVEGFKNCEQQHGIRYTSFIGDGDSSVYFSLIEAVPWGYSINKIECANHSLKCYRSALEKLVHDNPSYKGKGKLTEGMRKRLTKAARYAIISRSSETNRHEAIIKLERDLLNGPLHCFGYHSKCSTDFCTTVKQLVHLSSSSHSNTNSGVSSSISDTQMTNTFSECSNSSSSSVDNSIHSDDDQDDLEDATMELQQERDDAADDTNLDEVRTVPAAATASPTTQEETMICDVQRLLARLIGKASQLLGMLVNTK